VAGAAGIDFTTYATEAVLEPLGLRATEPVGSPAAGWRSTAPEVAVLMDQVRAPTVVHHSTMAAATTVAFPGRAGVLPGWGRHDPCDWGLGFEIRDDKVPHWTGRRASPATVGHFGGAGTFAWHDPAVAVTCVGLGDRPFDDWARTTWPALADEVLTILG
jgi:CubicO group peptidase (beta-lactamase class C family)